MLEIFVQQYFRSYQCVPYIRSIIAVLVKKIRVKTFHHFAQDENYLTVKFSRITVHVHISYVADAGRK